MHTPFAHAAVQPLSADDPARKAILETATGPLRAAAGDRILLQADQVDRMGPWVFVLGTMRDAGGGRPDFSGTDLAERAAAGGLSDVYVALLRASAEPEEAASTDDAGGHWELLDHAIGPGDVAWLDWPQRHAAPRGLFGF